MDANLAFGRRTLLPRVDADPVAARVVRGLDRDVGFVHYRVLGVGVGRRPAQELVFFSRT